MREYVTAYDIANDIRMTRSQHSGTFLIVEGEMGDLRVYGRLVDSELCQIIPAYGKENAINALEILEKDDFAGVLAIVDADFWRLEGRKPSSQNLFITDTHDLETMILKSPVLEEKLLAEYGSAQKIENFIRRHGQNFHQVLLDIGRPIGYLRWISLRQNLSLEFEGINFGRFINQRTLVLDIPQLVKTVKNKSGRPDLIEGDLQNAIDEVTEPDHDPWDVCVGHDLICILSLGLRNVLGSNNANDVKPELLEKFLRAAYESSYFFATHLYQSLKNWENMHSSFRIFPIS
jgi:hypothetical protein